MDYGVPQFTEAQILQEFIKTDSYRMEVGKQLPAAQMIAKQICLAQPLQCTAPRAATARLASMSLAEMCFVAFCASFEPQSTVLKSWSWLACPAECGVLYSVQRA